MTKVLAALLLMLSLASCAPTETDALRTENTTLKRQLETVTTERDTFKAKLDAVRAALEGTVPVTGSPDATTPAPEAPSTPPVPDSTAPSIGSNTPPAPDSSPTAPAPDASATPAIPAPTPVDPAASEREARLKVYADNVLSAAQNFKSQAATEPPTDCSSGYKAGEYSVEKIADALPECVVTTSGDGAYGVRLRDASGQTISVP